MERSKAGVVVVGAGFAGLAAARKLAGAGVQVTVVDRHNYHTFQALLYQVATAQLEPESIAYPVRTALKAFGPARYLMAGAIRIDSERKVLVTDGGELPFTHLILATGSIPADFGIPGITDHAFTLKTLEDGVRLRNHLICSFERASRAVDVEERKKLLTFVVVGGGATGVEFAGALAELVSTSLKGDFPEVDFREARVILLEAAGELIAMMPPVVRRYTLERLGRMGVEVHLGAGVAKVGESSVELKSGEVFHTATVVWTAGVRAEETAAVSGFPTRRDGRVMVEPTLAVPGHPDIYAVGDLAAISEGAGVLPMVAQVAIQSGEAAARNILAALAGRPPENFIYRDLGSMVVVGRNAAGAEIGGRAYTGFPAWILWLVVHISRLIGFRNRLIVLMDWAWEYLFWERALRFVFPSDKL